LNSRRSALPASSGEWHRRVWSLAGPIIIANMSVPLVGAVDTAVVGHLPDPVYIGAVALGAVLFSFIFWGFAFLRMGTTGFVAQAFGVDDLAEVRLSMARALLLASVFGVLLVILQLPIATVALHFLDSSAQQQQLTYDYYSVRIWSAPATLANYAILGTLIGIQNTRMALLLQLLLNGINVTLDLIFVLGFDWNVKGVALASLLGEYSAAGLGLWLLLRMLKPDGGSWYLPRLLALRPFKAMLRVNLNILIRTLCLSFAWFYFTASGARLGEVTLAANAVLMHLINIMAYGLDGFAHAAEALAGSAYGARNRSAFRAAIKISSVWALAVSIIYCLLYALAGPYIIAAITSIEAVRTQALDYLPWVMVLPLISVWSFQLDGIFIGTIHTVEMRNAMILSLAGFLAAVALLLPVLANHGLWLALSVLMILRALTLAWYYPRIEQALDNQRKN
jgi:MATE family multidrug resistance protein